MLQAIKRMRRALSECVIDGVPTTSPYHVLLLESEDFIDGNVDTGFIPNHQDELSTPPDEDWRLSLNGTSKKKTPSSSRARSSA